MSWKHIVAKEKKIVAENSVGEIGVIVGHYGTLVDVRLVNGEKKTVRVKRNSGLVVGDNVTIEANGVQNFERKSELIRTDITGNQRVIAANLDVLGIVVATQPITSDGFIDRVIVGALAANLEPFIIVNKSDISGSIKLFNALKKKYAWRFPVLKISADKNKNLQELEDFMAQDLRGALVGVSGVGKSSILNALCPEIDLETCEINEDGFFGRHATTTATLHKLPKGGEIIDTPGFRDFRLGTILSQDLAWYFPDFYKVFKDKSCKFKNCLHQTEPQCVILEACKTGEISEESYQTYLSIFKETSALEQGKQKELFRKRAKK